MQDKKGFIALLLNAIILGTYGTWVRIFQHSLSGYQQVTARSIISCALAVIIFLFLRGSWKINKSHTKHLALYLFCFALSTILFTLAALQTTIALSVFGLYIGSILTAFILGAIFFKEKLSLLRIASICFVLFALAAFTYPFSLQFLNAGFFIGIASGIFDGVGNAFKKYFAGKIERPLLIVLQLFSTLLVALFLTFTSHQSLFLNISVFIWVLMLVYGFCSITSSYLSLFGFQHFDLNLGTIITSSELFWAPVFAFLVFRETLTFYQFLGGILIAAAILIPYVKQIKVYSGILSKI